MTSLTRFTCFSALGLLLSTAVAFAQAQEVPKLAGEMGPTLLQLAGALLLIVGLIYLSIWLMKKYSHGKLSGSGNLISIIERRHLAPKQAIYLIKVADQHLLIGASENGISKLSEIEIAEPPRPVGASPTAANTGRFGQILKQAKETLMPMLMTKNRSQEV